MIELDLRDIHLPEAFSWWPLAPGWWLLILLLAVIVILVFWLWRLRRRSLKRYCLGELARIRHAVADGAGVSQVLAEVSTLLRRVAISRLGRQPAAKLSGADWQACVADLSRNPAFDDAQLQLLSRGRFQRDPDCDVERLLAACDRWIRALPRE
jgi:hypothetical protein